MTTARKKQVGILVLVIIFAVGAWFIVNNINAEAASDENGSNFETVEYMVDKSNEDALAVWQEFYDKTNAGEAAKVRVYQNFEEGVMDKEIWFDGEKYYVQNNGSDEIREYQYFYTVEGHLPDAAVTDCYGILADKEYTFADITGYYYSNLSEAREIEFEEVFLIMTPVE